MLNCLVLSIFAGAPAPEGASPPPVQPAAVEAVDLVPSEAAEPSEAAAPTEEPVASEPSEAAEAAEPVAPTEVEMEETAVPAQSQPPTPPPVQFRPVSSREEFRDRRRRPDRDIDWRVELGANGGTSTVPHPSFGLFSDERAGMSTAEVELRFDRKLSGPVFLGAGLGYRYMGSEGSAILGDHYTEIDFHELRAFGRAAFMPVEGLDLYLLGGVGPSFVDYGLGWETNFADGKTVALLAEGMGGVMAYLPKRWLPNREGSRFTAGIDLGAGYTYRTAIDVEPRIELDEEPLSHDFTNLGRLQASAITWRLGVFIRFM